MNFKKIIFYLSVLLLSFAWLYALYEVMILGNTWLFACFAPLSIVMSFVLSTLITNALPFKKNEYYHEWFISSLLSQIYLWSIFNLVFNFYWTGKDLIFTKSIYDTLSSLVIIVLCLGVTVTRKRIRNRYLDHYLDDDDDEGYRHKKSRRKIINIYR